MQRKNEESYSPTLAFQFYRSTWWNGERMWRLWLWRWRLFSTYLVSPLFFPSVYIINHTTTTHLTLSFLFYFYLERCLLICIY